MIKKILNILFNAAVGVSIGMIVLMFIFNLLLANYIKQELSYIYAGIDIISFNSEQLEKRIEEKTIIEIKKDVELMDKIIKLSDTIIKENDKLEEKVMASVCELGIISTQTDENLKAEDKLINYQIDKNYAELNKSIKTLKEQIERQPTETEQLENNLKQITVMIENTTQNYQGSGVTIKYKDNFYVLSAAHLIGEETDTLYLVENEEPITKLKTIKIDTERDLVLFKSENENIILKVYTELADKELEKGDPIYVVGNPLGIEDILSEGRILKNTGFTTYFIDHSYFGSSGGGIFTKQGKLLGIIQTIGSIQPYENIPSFVINGAARLNMIKDFLGDIK